MTDPGTTDGTTQTEGQTARDIFPEDDGIPEVAQDDSPTMQRAEDPSRAQAQLEQDLDTTPHTDSGTNATADDVEATADPAVGGEGPEAAAMHITDG